MDITVARRIRTVLLIVLFAAGALWLLSSRRPPERQHFAAIFTDASEVVPRNDVRINDVIVGKVASVTLDGLHARIEFTVDDDVELPADTRAELRQVSLLGEQYLALVPEGEGRLDDGATIPLERTRRATDFEELVGAGGELAAAVSVSNVNELVNGFNRAFGADPDRLGRLLDATAATARAFNAATPDLEATIDRIEAMSRQLAPNSEALAQSIDQLAAGMTALDNHKGDLATFTTGLADFSDRMAELLTRNEQRFVQGTPQLRQVFGELVDSFGDIELWLDNFYELNAAWSCIGDGNFLNETFLLVPTAAYIDYGPGDCDPEKGNRSRSNQHQTKVAEDAEPIDTDLGPRSEGLDRVYGAALSARRAS